VPPAVGILLPLLALPLLGACAGRPPADDPDRIAAGVGLYDVTLIARSRDLEGTVWVEGRGGPRWRRLRPVVGIETNSHQDVYAYAGVLADLPLGRGFRLVPSFAAGWWTKGDADSKDLGNAIEFRSSVELGYRFSDGVQVGVAVQHVSNANLAFENPGVDRVVLGVSVPLDAVTGRRAPARSR
jgi:hypothetical protein